MSLEEDQAASALAACRAAEAKIGDVQKLLLNPRPETLDRAMADLAEVAAILNTLVNSARQGDSRKWTPAALASFHQIRLAARAVAEHKREHGERQRGRRQHRCQRDEDQLDVGSVHASLGSVA